MTRGDWTPEPLRPDDTFPLWGFDVSGRFVLTRGRTGREAWEYVGGELVSALPIDAPRWYGSNHDRDWLTRPMWWLCERLGLDPRNYGHLTREERLQRHALSLLGVS